MPVGVAPPAAVIAALAVCGVLMVSPLYGAIPLIPPIARNFHAPPSAVGLIGFAFGFAYALACLLFGPLSDVTGRRRILVAGVFVEALIGIAVAASPSLPLLIFGRLAQGFAAGTFGPVALGYVAESYTGRLRHAAIAVLSTGLISAGSIGQIVAQLIAEAWGWRTFFTLIGGAELIVGVSLVLILREPPIDRSSRSLKRTYAAEGALLQTAPIRGTYVVGFVLYLGFVLYYLALGPHVARALGGSPATLFALRAVALPGMLLTLLAGPVINRLGARHVVAIGLIIETAGLALSLAGSADVRALTVASAAFSFGFACAAVSMNALVTELGGAVRGTAMAFFVFVSFTGASLAPLVFERLTHYGFDGTIFELAQATAVAWLVIVISVPRDAAAGQFLTKP